MTSTAAPALTPARRALRAFVGALVGVHAVFIAVYYVFDIAAAAERTQRWFAWGWMVITVAVIVAGLQRIRRLRAAMRAARGAPAR